MIIFCSLRCSRVEIPRALAVKLEGEGWGFTMVIGLKFSVVFWVIDGNLVPLNLFLRVEKERLWLR